VTTWQPGVEISMVSPGAPAGADPGGVS